MENAPRAEREKFYADILEKETGKTDVRMMAYFHASLLRYREGDFRAAREILEPFVIDYQSYAYRPEIIACFNLMGVAAYCECVYALARFYIREGLKIAREHKEASRYSYEYNNLAVTYLAQRDYEKALDAIREAEQHLPQSDKEMHAYVYRNLAEISCHVGHLDEACAEAGEIVRFQAESMGLHVEEEHPDVHTVNLLGSELYLKKILLNLFSNCAKYNKPGGAIYTRLRELQRTDDTVTYEFFIRDTGIGMTQEFIDNHLFEAFVQGENAARSQYGGTGLGMSIVAQLIRKMKGTIKVESTVGEGSSFTVVLPFEIDHDPPAVETRSTQTGDLCGKRLLVVEDNELNMEIAEFMLKGAGAEVDPVFDGESAVKAYTDAAPGTYLAVLMDLMMPVMDGYAAARAIRESGRPDAKTIPIIAMSANAYAEDVQKCLDTGMNAHISKPLYKEVMLETIKRFV